MARIRSVKPEFWTDPDNARLSRDARLLYISLWNVSDEHGRLHGDPRFVKGQTFPYDDDLTADVIDVLLDELADAGCVDRYEADGNPYLFLPNLAKHQRLDGEKVPSRLPEPPRADSAQVGADESGKNPDESEPRADSSGLLYVAGSRLQAAGGDDVAAAAESLATQMQTAVPKSTHKHIKARLSEGWTVDALVKAVASDAITGAASAGAVLTARIRDLGPPPKPRQRPDAGPRCEVRGHSHEPASSCRACAADRLTGAAS